jgi:hypothetical protein
MTLADSSRGTTKTNERSRAVAWTVLMLAAPLLAAAAGADPTPPGAPQNLVATGGPGLFQITLTWSDPPAGTYTTLTGFNVYCKCGMGTWHVLASTSGTTHTYTHTGPEFGDFVYKVTALNDAGESAFSNQACADPYPFGLLLTC